MLLWGGQALSVFGYQVQDIALPLLVLALTQSPLQAGIVAALDTLAFVLFGLPAGALIDRWDRKKVMMACDATRMIAVGSIPIALWAGLLTMAQVYLVAAVTGILAPFYNYAETASLPNVVSKEQLPSAMSQNFATVSVSGFIGPPLGGLLYSIDRALPFLVNAVSFAASVASLRSIRTEFQGERRQASRRLRAEVVEGVAWVWRHPLIRFLALMNGVGNMVWTGSFLVLVVLARQMGASPVAIGVIFAIQSVGGLIGAIVGGRIQRRLSLGQITIGMVWVIALLFPLYAVAPNPVSLGLIGAAISFTFPIYSVVQLSHRASVVPNELLGRVTSSVRLITVGGMSLGPVLAGALLQSFGPRTTIVVSTGCLLTLAVATTANSHVRNAPALGGLGPEVA